VPRIFISYVHEDVAVAEALQKLLRAELALGDEIFLAADETKILAGDVWLEKIRAAIRSAKIMLLLLSGRSFGRSWVHFEAGAAWLSRTKTVVPLCLGRMNKSELPHPYSGMQTLQLPDDASYLVNSIKEKLTVRRVSEHPAAMLEKTVAMAVDVYVREPRQPRTREMEELLDPYLAFKRVVDSWKDE
jgi:hypothetical protein